MINDEDRNGIWNWQRGGKSGATKSAVLVATKSSMSSIVEIASFGDIASPSGLSNLRAGGTSAYYGESFSASSPFTLDSCKFYLRKNGSPTGNMTAKLYAHTGTFGSGGTPTGSVLATSDVFNSATLGASFAFVTFSFSGANRVVSPAGNYVIVLDGSSVGDISNSANIGGKIPAASYAGNAVQSTDGSTWAALSNDAFFYVYGSVMGSLDFGGRQGYWYRIQLTTTGTTGTVAVRIGNGLSHTVTAASSLSYDEEYLSGRSILYVTPSSDFDGDVTGVSIYQLN